MEPRTGPQLVQGSCHCGAVRFEARIDLKSGFRCNCSICTKVSAFVASAEPGSFRILSGDAALARYEFGARQICRHFCKHCGVQCFARSSSSGHDGDDINVVLNTLDGIELGELPAVYFDGRHDDFEPRPLPQRITRT